ncbi:lipocalin family protein [Streptacidiphilus sp. N1-12]|uniref:Lipocalin family protein n=2 Tax=Streptacidiphilus alkalitolerans TaxID=3342712 RepID=A0ABV6VIC6_9ACTN
MAILRTTAVVTAAAVGTAAAARAVGRRMRATAGDPDQAPPLQPVKEVDVQRYLGSWFQIAAVPAWYELQCAKDAQAEYTLRSDGTVGVRNSCITWWGSDSRITGAARPLDEGNNRLNVSFRRADAGEGYRHGGTANYVVIGVGPDYDWAVVTDDSRRSGFVLSRTPVLTDDQYDGAREALERSGLDAGQLRTTRQTGGAQQRVRFSAYPSGIQLL